MFPEGRALEFLLAGIIALIVVGPKDLPILLRKLGRFMAKLRSLAAEFRASFDEMARQSELDELRKEVDAMRHAQFADAAVHPETHDALADINDGLSAVSADLRAPTPPVYFDAPSTPEPTPQAEPSKPRARRSAAAKAPSKAAAKPRARKKTAGPEA